MGIKETLSAMMERAFSEELFDSILHDYQEEMKRIDFKACEEEFERACANLPDLLPAEQLEKVAEAERRYKAETRINLQIGFKRGLYAGFVLVDKPDEFRNSFTTLIMKEEVTKHSAGDFYEAREQKVSANHILDQLDEKTVPSAQEHLSSVVAAWDERSYAALRYGFNLGYHTAQSVLSDVDPKRHKEMQVNGWQIAEELLLPFEFMN